MCKININYTCNRVDNSQSCAQIGTFKRLIRKIFKLALWITCQNCVDMWITYPFFAQNYAKL